MNNSGSTGNSVFTGMLAAVTALLLALTLNLGPVARLVPLAVAVPALALFLFQLVLDLAPGLADRFTGIQSGDTLGIRRRWNKPVAPVDGRQNAEVLRTHSSELSALLWLSLMAALIWSVGLMAGLPLYLLLHLRRRAHAGWPLSIGVSAGILGLTYGLVVLVLEMRLFEGQFRQWL